MMRKRRWTDQELQTAVEQSLSIAQVLRKLNLAIAGGSYTSIKRHIARLKLDTSHWSGQSRKNRYGKKRELCLDDILVPGTPYASSEIRRYVVRAGLKANKCEQCGLSEWQSSPITIQLHHMNGIRDDHRLENLQMLCPNCHSQK